MKIRKLFIPFIVLLSLTTWADDSRVFITERDQPNRNVKSDIKSKNEFSFEVKGDQESIKEIEQLGLGTKPVHVKNVDHRVITTQTESPDANGTFKFVKKFEDFNSHTENAAGEIINVNQHTQKLVGGEIHGHIDNTGDFKIDKFENMSISAQEEQVMMHLLKEGFRNFPKDGMKLGASFVSESNIPLPIPHIGQQPIAIKIITMYTLKKVEEGKAYLNLATDIKLGHFPSGVNLDAQGGGDGRIIYDIDKKLVEETKENYEFKIEAIKDNVTYIINQKSEGVVKQSIY